MFSAVAVLNINDTGTVFSHFFFAHRDYTIASEVVIKQFPQKMVIANPSGFPKGVNLDNILIVNSAPRSRLMADVLQKTGLVERSAQGVDKIFSIPLSEGKPEPIYQDSDAFEKLSLYTCEAKLHIDNNPVERAIRPVAIGRKNYSFAGSHDAAQRSAMIYSLFSRCTLHNINPYTWLLGCLR